MRIALGTDHAGFALKEAVKAWLIRHGHSPADFGVFTDEPSDYPQTVLPAAAAAALGECDRAIVFGGSGNGEAMAANKIRGVRCGLCWTPEAARLNRAHNDGNVLSLGARLLEPSLALEIVEVWLATAFEGGRHTGRLALLADLGADPGDVRRRFSAAPRP